MPALTCSIQFLQCSSKQAANAIAQAGSKACCLNKLSSDRGRACSGSKLLTLLVQWHLLLACCCTGETGYYKSTLACFTRHRGCGVLSFCMSFACRTAAKSRLCWQAVFTVKDLLLSVTPRTRHNHFLPQQARTQKAMLVDLLCSVAPPRLCEAAPCRTVGTSRYH